MPADATVQIFADEIPQIDAEFASQFLAPCRGCTVVEQWPARTQTRSGLLIPEVLSSAYRGQPDIGTVLGACPSVALVPGDVVVFNHEHGKRMSHFEAGGYFAGNDVRLFGRAVKEDASVKRISWRRSIMARLENWEEGMQNATIRPVGDWVLVRRDELHDRVKVEGTSIEIHLTDKTASRSSRGIVVACGELVDHVEPGDRVIYLANPRKNIPVPHPVLAPEFQDKNLVLMVEDAILTAYVLEQDELECAA